MSDSAVLAIIGLATVVVAGVPATVTALMSRRTLVEARDHAATAADAASQAKETLGDLNGDGDAMTMLARTLVETGQLLRAQEQAARTQEELKETQQELKELQLYAEKQVHRLNGQVGQMWRDWAISKGIDPNDLPPPAPSPKEDQ